MLKISYKQWFFLIVILCGCLSPAYAATSRDKAARQFEQKMNGLNIQKNTNSDQFSNYNNINYESDQGYNVGDNQMNNNYSDENEFDNQVNDQQDSFNENYNNTLQDEDLIQRIKDLEDDMGDLMRRISKLERDLKTEKSKNMTEKKANKKKTTKKPKKSKS